MKKRGRKRAAGHGPHKVYHHLGSTPRVWSLTPSIHGNGLDWRQGLPEPEQGLRGDQSEWEKPVIKITIHTLKVPATNDRTTARLLALRKPGAGDWLNALPSPQRGSLLDDEYFRVICALQLGGSVSQPHRCSSGEEVDELGYHGLKCKKSRGRLSRHAAVNDIISRALCTADVPNISEQTGCSHADGKKPGGLTLVPWSRGRCLVWDFTCADTLCSSYVRKLPRAWPFRIFHKSQTYITVEP